jgi:hypothetical protein
MGSLCTNFLGDSTAKSTVHNIKAEHNRNNKIDNMNFYNSIILLYAVLLASFSVSAINCGGPLSVDFNGDATDSKVYGCPWGYSWEKCCSDCALNLHHQGYLGSGWLCCTTITGIWLKGGNHDRC